MAASEVVSDAESTASQRKRLPHNLQRQLLIDLGKQGGIHHYDQNSDSEQALVAILDRRQQLYGRRGEKLRVRIGAKVQRWKLLPHDKFQAVLAKFRVADGSFEEDTKEDTKPPPTHPAANSVPASITVRSVDSNSIAPCDSIVETSSVSTVHHTVISETVNSSVNTAGAKKMFTFQNTSKCARV